MVQRQICTTPRNTVARGCRLRAGRDFREGEAPAEPGLSAARTGASPWRGAKLGLTGLKSRPPKERFCCAHAAFFSPPCEGGAGGVGQTASASPGVGRRTSASSVCSPFARNDVRKRHALKAGEAAHAPSTSSIGRAQHGSFVHSKLTGPPPLAPPSQGGEKEGGLAEVAQRIRKECTSGATPTLHHASLALRKPEGRQALPFLCDGRTGRLKVRRSRREPAPDRLGGIP